MALIGNKNVYMWLLFCLVRIERMPHSKVSRSLVIVSRLLFASQLPEN